MSRHRALANMKERRSHQRGSVSLWAVLVCFALVVMVGIAVDFGGQAIAEQRARSIAGEAARAGGQVIDLDDAARGLPVRVDASRAAAAAQRFLQEREVSGDAAATDSTHITVTVTDRYETTFLSIIGIDTLPVRGRASSTIIRTLGGEPR